MSPARSAARSPPTIAHALQSATGSVYSVGIYLVGVTIVGLVAAFFITDRPGRPLGGASRTTSVRVNRGIVTS